MKISKLHLLKSEWYIVTALYANKRYKGIKNYLPYLSKCYFAKINKGEAYE